MDARRNFAGPYAIIGLFLTIFHVALGTLHSLRPTVIPYNALQFTIAFASLWLWSPGSIANAGEIIRNGTLGNGTSLTSWTATGGILIGDPGAKGYYWDTNGGTGSLTQTSIPGWNAGSAPSGAVQLTMVVGWNNSNGSDGATPATLRVSVGGTLYATVSTGTTTGTPLVANVTFQNGASGTPTTISTTSDPTVAYRNWQGAGVAQTVTINLPASVAATGTLQLAFSAAGTLDDIFVANISAISSKPILDITKVSEGGVGSFTFTGTNGWTSQTITTTVAGTGVTGQYQALAAASTATTITETIPAGYAVTAISCTGIGSGTATPNLAAGSVTLNAAATASANNIACTFTNAKLPTVRLTKVSNGGVGTFNFSGDNGFGSDSITTAVAGTGVNGVTKTLSAASTSTTITETIPSTYFLVSISCSGLNGGTATPNLSTGALVLNTTATAPGNVVTCTYTNTLAEPKLSIVKSASTAGPLTAGQVITYTFKVSNTGNRPISAVSVSETFNGYGTAPVPRNETLSIDTAPTGDSSNGTSDDGVWQTLGVGDEVTFTAPYTVTQQDIDQLQ